ncbi:hypothetical protein FIBSPDRAFT_761336 [Athelia psychrophila]|uniref:DASH complex subunit DAD2 n=1 Tax=Athelia psychrophila TaxID=1759441 RepID=A0A165XCY8_9AGAM|nr:hypothetical protein FIBSPDRAFT_761336 [Fibularhizoctonia sp. CBS 109695]
MRQSVAPSRTSHAASSLHQPPNPAALARLQEKMKEYETVSALEKASALFVKRVEGLGEDCEDMAAAGVVHGQVLEQWPNMFRILGLFLEKREQHAEPGENASAEDGPPASDEGSRLVRIPIDELQAAK